MNRIIKKEYKSFHRNILKEFMTDAMLKVIDEEYTKAKIKRATKQITK